MNKKVLVITPFCAPETHAAVFRAHKLVKYLKREGWQPIILTVATNYTYNEDLGLLKELEGIPIYRTRYVEPTLRGLKMWLTGKDLTYKTLKKKGFYDNSFSNHENDLKAQKPKPIQQVYHYLLEHYLKKPDRFWTWKKSAIKKAKEIIKQENVEFIYTTMSPYTVGEIGLKIKSNYPAIKWIADFRDPQLSVSRNHSSIKHVFNKQKKIKELVLNQADRIITASYAHKLMLLSRYGSLSHKEIYHIPTGVDNDYLPSKSVSVLIEEDYIVFVGEYLQEYGDYFFKILSNLNTNLKIRIIGNININQAILLEILDKYNLRDRISFIDHMPQKKLYNIVKGAKAALLIPNSLWWCSFAKMADYIALEVPIIAKVPDLSEARMQLNKAGLGLFLTGNEKEDLDTLTSFFIDNESPRRVNKNFCKNFLATTQTNSFIKILDEVRSR